MADPTDTPDPGNAAWATALEHYAASIAVLADQARRGTIGAVRLARWLRLLADALREMADTLDPPH